MNGLSVSAVHLTVAILGFWWLYRVSRYERSERRVTATGFGMAAAMAGFLYLVTPLHPDTSQVRHLSSFPPALPELWYLVRLDDFTLAYWKAGRALLDGPGALAALYERGARGGFVNLPIAAYLFLPFGLIEDRGIAAIAVSFLGLAGVLLSWKMICNRYGFNPFERAASLFAMAGFGPLVYSLREGNLSHLVLPGMVWGVVLIGARRDILAGVVFGVIAVLKPPLILIGVYLALRGRFAAVLGVGLAGATLCGLSLAVFGWDMHLLWYQQAIEPYAQHPIAAYNTQSIGAFIARFETGPAGYDNWYPHALLPANNMLVKLLSISLLAVFGWAALAGKRGAGPGTAETDCELYMTLVATCLISTLSWSHYYLWLLPVLAYVFARTRTGGVTGRWSIAAAVAYAMMAPNEYLNFFVWLDPALPGSNFVVSHRMIGALVLVPILVHIRRQQASSRSSAGDAVKAAA